MAAASLLSRCWTSCWTHLFPSPLSDSSIQFVQGSEVRWYLVRIEVSGPSGIRQASFYLIDHLFKAPWVRPSDLVVPFRRVSFLQDNQQMFRHCDRRRTRYLWVQNFAVLAPIRPLQIWTWILWTTQSRWYHCLLYFYSSSAPSLNSNENRQDHPIPAIALQRTGLWLQVDCLFRWGCCCSLWDNTCLRWPSFDLNCWLSWLSLRFTHLAVWASIVLILASLPTQPVGLELSAIWCSWNSSCKLLSWYRSSSIAPSHAAGCLSQRHGFAYRGFCQSAFLFWLLIYPIADQNAASPVLVGDRRRASTFVLILARAWKSVLQATTCQVMGGKWLAASWVCFFGAPEICFRFRAASRTETGSWFYFSRYPSSTPDHWSWCSCSSGPDFEFRAPWG